jgi:cytidyltransferase-like protein
MQSLGARIIALEEFKKIRPKLDGKLVVTSGGYDPIHPGHISCILDSKQYGDYLAIIVNGDAFLRVKKGKPFQDLETRCAIVSALPGVDYVIPFEIENDQTVCVALEVIKPDVFTKGGDRIDTTTPEYGLCKKLGTKFVSGVGLGKQWSSSDFLKEWSEFTWKNK